MLLKNIIDLTDGLFSRFLCIAENSRLDIDIFIGIICRFTIIILLIMFKDIKQYSIGELVAWIIVFIIQHIYIMFIERNYILIGESQVLKREIQYKIMDSLQLLIGIIFLALNLNSYIEIITLVLFSINFLLNLYFIIYKFKIKEGYTKNYSKIGGIYQFFVGFLFGAVGVIIIILRFGSKYVQKDTFETTFNYNFVYLLTLIGQSVLVVESFIIFYRYYEEFLWSKDWAKGILGYFYGLNVGIFSIIYGFIIGFILFIWLWWEYHSKRRCEKQDKRRQESEQISQR